MSKIFIGIDCQVDFIDGALPNADAIRTIGAVSESAEYARLAGFDVFWTLDTHGDDYPETLESKYVPPHCRQNTAGWALHSKVEIGENDGSFIKPTFGSVEMMNSMMLEDDCEPIDIIIMCGYDTDICGISNALMLRAGLPNTRIVWLSYASAATCPEHQDAALAVMRSCEIEVCDSYEAFREIVNSLK